MEDVLVLGGGLVAAGVQAASLLTTASATLYDVYDYYNMGVRGLADLPKSCDSGSTLIIATGAVSSLDPLGGLGDVVLEAALVCRKLIFCSTVAVYGSGVHCTSAEPKPESPYGQSRLDAEMALIGVAQNAGASLMVIRLPGVFGPSRFRGGRLQRALWDAPLDSRSRTTTERAALHALGTTSLRYDTVGTGLMHLARRTAWLKVDHATMVGESFSVARSRACVPEVVRCGEECGHVG